MASTPPRGQGDSKGAVRRGFAMEGHVLPAAQPPIPMPQVKSSRPAATQPPSAPNRPRDNRS
jgi:hypothetical protein